MWIVAIAVTSSDFSITTVNLGIGLLVACSFLGMSNRLFLCAEDFRWLDIASPLNGPTVRVLDYMLIFSSFHSINLLLLTKFDPE